MANLINLDGIMNSSWRIGGNAGNSIKAETYGLSIRDNAGSTLKNLGVARARDGQSSDAAAYLDVKEKVIPIEFNFAGASPTSPGANTGKYGFCHTSGGLYTAGAIYLDTGVALSAVTVYKSQLLTTSSAISGTVSLVSGGLYIAMAATAPYSWSLRGDGAPASTGLEKSTEIPITTTSGIVSTTSIPTNSEIREATVVVTSAYTSGATIQAQINGGTPLTVIDTTESDATATGTYIKPQVTVVGSINAGTVIVNIGGSPSAGAAKVIVKWVETYYG